MLKYVLPCGPFENIPAPRLLRGFRPLLLCAIRVEWLCHW